MLVFGVGAHVWLLAGKLLGLGALSLVIYIVAARLPAHWRLVARAWGIVPALGVGHDLVGQTILALQRPLYDGLLLRLDVALLGGHASQWAEAVAWPPLIEALQIGYTLYFIVALPLVHVLAHQRRLVELNRYVSATTVGLSTVLVFYVLMPARTPSTLWRMLGDGAPIVFTATLQGGATAALLAWHLGMSRNRAAELLGDLPASGVTRVCAGGRVVYDTQHASTPRAARDAWRRFLAAARRLRRAPRADLVRDRIEQAARVLRDGDWAVLRPLLGEPWLDATLLRRGLPVRLRDELSAAVLVLRADAGMQRGRPEEAIAAAERALTLLLDPAERSRALGILGAATRMLGAGSAQRSIAAYRQAAAEASRVSGATRRLLQRAANVAVVAPEMVAGSLVLAEKHARTALDLGDGSPAQIAESTLRWAQVLASLGATERAAALLEPLQGAALPPWLEGWRVRIGVSFLGHTLGAEEWNRQMASAWSTNQGYGFQRRLILGRLAAHGDRCPISEVMSPLSLEFHSATGDETRARLASRAALNHRKPSVAQRGRLQATDPCRWCRHPSSPYRPGYSGPGLVSTVMRRARAAAAVLAGDVPACSDACARPGPGQPPLSRSKAGRGWEPTPLCLAPASALRLR